MCDLTIIIPVYNEEEGISRIEKDFQPFFSSTKLRVRVLFVDDGSTDQSLSQIHSICDRNSQFQYISLVQNRGLSSALKAGFDHAVSKWVGYIDADLQTSPEDFLLFEPYLNDFDLVIGNRVHRKDNLTKRLTSEFANGFRSWLLEDGVSDSGCPLKILKTEMAQSLPFFKGMHRFIPALILIMGGSVKQVPVRHYPRMTGYSKFSFKNRFWGPIADTIAIRWMKSRVIQYQIKAESNPVEA
ncbi:glycosyltransferase family 2 protein [Algoriphagus sp.]|uniref:glycosyltransferase family 2 protein n=1 Tax=Algoriphagus sp. TaxID=1872435 RepID=UPI00391991B5